ncbi:MAG: hypothetical protein ABIQ40_11645 [Bacteroidia bacterium]
MLPYTIKNIITAFCLLFAVSTLQAQTAVRKVKINEIILNSYVSGNSFGVQRNAAVGFSIGKHFGLSMGPTFNRGFQKNTGGLVSARYYMVSNNESDNKHLQLISIVSFERMQNQSLSQNVVELEQQMAFNMKNDEAFDFSVMRYKGWEAAAGIGLAYRCDFGLLISAEASLCYYSSERTTSNQVNTFHDENGTSLRLGFGIGWSIGKITTPKVSLGEPVLLLQRIE